MGMTANRAASIRTAIDFGFGDAVTPALRAFPCGPLPAPGPSLARDCAWHCIDRSFCCSRLGLLLRISVGDAASHRIDRSLASMLAMRDLPHSSHR
jgi:hypothetical protein